MRYYLIYPFFTPLLFVLLNLYLIKKIDKELVYKIIPIQYKKVYDKEVGIKVGNDRWASSVYITDIEGGHFQRRYHGLLNRLFIGKHIEKIIQQAPRKVGIYYYPKKYKTEKRNLFFNIGKEDKKGTFYYLDILNYLKYAYYILFIFGYFGAIGWLLYIGQGKTDMIYFAGVLVNIILCFLYLLL